MRKLFLKIFQYPQETPVLECIFKNLADLQDCNFFKKRLQSRCFPVNIAKFLILPILKNICKRLHFNFFNGSLDCMTASGLMVQVTALVFVFKSTSLVLKQVPTCIRKPKTNIFDKSIRFLHWLFLVVLDGFKSFQMVLCCLQIILGHFRSLKVVLDRFRLLQPVPHFSKYRFPVWLQVFSINCCI